jgi:hypothetical protein
MIRRQGGVRNERQKVGILGHDPTSLLPLFGNLSTGEAAAGLIIEPAGTLDPFDDLARHNRKANDLRMRMLLGRSGVRSMILENNDMSHTRVAVKIAKPMPVSLNNPLHMRDRENGQRDIVPGALNKNLVKAHAIHARLPRNRTSRRPHLAGLRQDRKLVDYRAQEPVAILAINAKSLFGRGRLIPQTKRAIRQKRTDLLWRSSRHEISAALRSLRGDDNPLASDLVFADLRHTRLSSHGKRSLNREYSNPQNQLSRAILEHASILAGLHFPLPRLICSQAIEMILMHLQLDDKLAARRASSGTRFRPPLYSGLSPR